MVKPCEWCGAMNSDNVRVVSVTAVKGKMDSKVLCREDFANKLLIWLSYHQSLRVWRAEVPDTINITRS